MEAGKLEDASFTDGGPGKLGIIKQEADSPLHYNNNKSPLPGEDRADRDINDSEGNATPLLVLTLLFHKRHQPCVIYQKKGLFM